MSAGALMAEAVALIQTGRLGNARALLEAQGAKLAPELRQLLAKLQGAAGDKLLAVATMRAALSAAPDLPEGRYELGVLLLEAGDAAAAAEQFKAVVAAEPGHDGARFNLAWTLRHLGCLDEAIAAYRALLEHTPAHPRAWFNLGNALRDGKRLAEAAKAYGKLLEWAPEDVVALSHFGVTLHEIGRLDEAEAALRTAVRLDPKRPEALNGLGNVLASKGDFPAAIEILTRLAGIDPDDAVAACNLASVFAESGEYGQARRVLEALIARGGGKDGRVLNHLGAVLLRAGRPVEAERVLLQAIQLLPKDAEAHNNLGRAYSALGRLDDMLAAYRRAHDLAPENAVIHSNLLFALTHDARMSPVDLLAEHKRFGEIQERLAGPPMVLPPVAALSGRRLRIGYVSPDFREHAVAILFEPILANHDKSAVEIFCYASRLGGDETTKRLQSHADHWRVIAGYPADAAADIIRADCVDVLVDLAGHTSGNALPVFARKPAPLQVTWLGYPGTTGLSRMAYRLGMGGLRPAFHPFSTELIVNLSTPPQFREFNGAPQTPPPFLHNGAITFGSVNKKLKANAEVIRVWSRILKAVPSSRLMMVVDDADDPVACRNLLDEFAAEGVAAGAVVLEGRRPLAGFLDLLGQTDICLDPFPYGGGTTTLFNCWMGVPTISLEGPDQRQGSGAVCLRQLDLGELVGHSVEEYIGKACALAADQPRLEMLRADLRARMLLSPMMDGAACARDLERLLADLWRQGPGAQAE